MDTNTAVSRSRPASPAPYEVAWSAATGSQRLLEAVPGGYADPQESLSYIAVTPGLMTKRSTNLLLSMMKGLQEAIERIEREGVPIRNPSNPAGHEPNDSMSVALPKRDTRTYRLDVRFTANEELLSFLAELAEIPGVASAAIAGSRAGQATIIVEVAPAERLQDAASPTIRCIQCSATISVGSHQVSHGLCHECVEEFLRDAGR